MKATTLIGFGLALGVLAGCEKDRPTEHTTLANVPADNSKKNERDQNLPTLTPGDQGENDVDRGITQRIRQEVVKADGLSMNGKNVKIITQGSVVTLRGPVKSEQERAQIVSIAQSIAGVTRVDNQLEIAAE